MFKGYRFLVPAITLTSAVWSIDPAAADEHEGDPNDNALESVETTEEQAAEQVTLDVCIDAYDQAQRFRKEGDLTESRKALMICSRKECPDIAKNDCTAWLGELRSDIPTMVIGARFEDGRDVIDLKVFLDGKLLTTQLDGRSIEVNPGVRVLRFEVEGRKPIEERFSIRVGERNRRILVTIPDQDQAPPPVSTPVRIPTLTYVLGGVGVAGLAGFGYFGATGLSRESDLERCKPSCASSEVSTVRTHYLLADVSLAVGLLAIGGASYFFFTKQEPERASLGVGLQTGPNRLGATLGGEF